MSNTDQVLIECLRAGITNFVLCPGARNAPLVLALERTEGLELYYHPDERGAAFFALGRTMAFNEPCAVVTTSGTAVAECLPAVIEAHYQGRPLVILSADRPAVFRESGAPQAIVQTNLFGDYASFGQDYTSPNSPFEDWDGIKPLHINIPLEEEFIAESIQALSLEEIGQFKAKKVSFDGAKIVEFLRERSFEGVVVMLGGLRPHEREPVFHLLEQLKVPVIADPHSGLREVLPKQLLLDPDQVLTQNLPGKILRLGEVPHGRFWRDLEKHTKVEVLSVTNSGYSGLARTSEVITGDVGRIITGIGEQPEIGDALDLLVAEQGRRNIIDELLEAYPSSEPALIRALSLHTATAESLYLGNSLPIREWSLFAQRELPVSEIWANRGANGIDGQISTWFGATREVEEAWCVIGDLTALYDMNALIMSSQLELAGRRLVIINNGGGRIFTHLPRLKSLSDSETSHFTQAHQTRFSSYAEMWGWDYLSVKSPEDLDTQEENPNPMIIEVLPDNEESEEFWNALRR